MNLISIEFEQGNTVWRFRMYEGSKQVGEAVAPPMTESDTWAAIDSWRESMFWKNRGLYLAKGRA